MFGVGSRKHKTHRHEVIAGAELLVTRKAFFCLKTSQAAKADLVLMVIFGEIVKLAREVGDWRVMFLPVEKICHTLLVFATDYQGMARTTFVIKEEEHIDVNLELIVIQINVVRCDWVW